MESSNEITTTTTFTDSIVFDVIKDVAKRAEAGLKKYNTTMDREDLIASDWVQHAYEEALDMAVYLKRLRKDMLAIEEELRAYKTQQMIKDKLAEDRDKKYVVVPCGTGNVTTVTTTHTDPIVYTSTRPKPNETYTDEEPHVKKRYANHR